MTICIRNRQQKPRVELSSFIRYSLYKPIYIHKISMSRYLTVYKDNLKK